MSVISRVCCHWMELLNVPAVRTLMDNPPLILLLFVLVNLDYNIWIRDRTVQGDLRLDFVDRARVKTTDDVKKQRLSEARRQTRRGSNDNTE
jgi:hypothetical protein